MIQDLSAETTCESCGIHGQRWTCKKVEKLSERCRQTKVSSLRCRRVPILGLPAVARDAVTRCTRTRLVLSS
ncbi:hypothetical protein CSUI_006508 [Cystoisospora suis]|uniref:Uncharacterized protein n=1 Tax=Cystoisospora suis TaxID=483139 RepID=A0A2C6KRI6_9APIC|nr:hypothetical protein CSUI_006508 [Cystoisospora suis]